MKVALSKLICSSNVNMNQLLDVDVLYEHLKCKKCSKWLNVFPIYYNPTVGNICGRCVAEDPTQNIHQRSLECILVHFQFPCLNKRYGCNKVLKFEEINAHEIDCVYNSVDCHLCYGWKGNFAMLQSHIAVSHGSRLLNHPVTIQLDSLSSNGTAYFAKNNDQMFTVLVKRSVGQTKLYLCVTINALNISTNSFCYQTRIYGDCDSSGITLPKYQVQVYQNSKVPTERMLEVNLTLLQSLILQLSKMKIVICANGKKYRMKNVGRPFGSNCPVCSVWLTVPIVMCRTGDSLCQPCSQKLSQCPLCRKRITRMRNFALEIVVNAMTAELTSSRAFRSSVASRILSNDLG